jgi:uncharacterized protein with PIN domain
MLGRLARRLRTLGYDASYDPGADDEELLRRSRRERRVLLTRDTRIGPAPSGRLFILRANDTAGQLLEVRTLLGDTAQPGLFTRCTICNDKLRRACGEEVLSRVPAFVHSLSTRFKACPACGRIYWPGSHRAGMLRSVGEVARECDAVPLSAGAASKNRRGSRRSG